MNLRGWIASCFAHCIYWISHIQLSCLFIALRRGESERVFTINCWTSSVFNDLSIAKACIHLRHMGNIPPIRALPLNYGRIHSIVQLATKAMTNQKFKIGKAFSTFTSSWDQLRLFPFETSAVPLKTNFTISFLPFASCVSLDERRENSHEKFTKASMGDGTTLTFLFSFYVFFSFSSKCFGPRRLFLSFRHHPQRFLFLKQWWWNQGKKMCGPFSFNQREKGHTFAEPCTMAMYGKTYPGEKFPFM